MWKTNMIIEKLRSQKAIIKLNKSNPDNKLNLEIYQTC